MSDSVPVKPIPSGMRHNPLIEFINDPNYLSNDAFWDAAKKQLGEESKTYLDQFRKLLPIQAAKPGTAPGGGMTQLGSLFGG